MKPTPSPLRSLFFAAALLALLPLILAGCDAGFERTNPYDSKASADRQEKATLHGRVSLEDPDDPFEGVTVTLEGEGQTLTTTTTTDGSFTFTGNVIPGRWTLRLNLSRYQETREGPLTLLPGEDFDAGTLYLNLRRALVTGQIELNGNDEQGNPVTDFSGVAVHLSASGIAGKIRALKASDADGDGEGTTGETDAEGSDSTRPGRTYTTLTGSDGSFLLGEVPFGSYILGAGKEGYSEENEEVEIGQDALILNPIRLTSSRGLLRINEGAEYSNAPLVTVHLASSGAIASWELSEDPEFLSGVVSGTVEEGAETLFIDSPFTLSGGDGPKTIHGRYTTLLGIDSDPATGTILLDTTAPVNGLLQLDGGAEFLADADCRVELSAFDGLSGVHEMMLSESDDFADASWQPVVWQTTHSFDPSEGTKTLYVRFRDKAGNVSESFTDAITQDTTPPSGCHLLLGSGEGYVSAPEVEIRLVCADAAQMQISTDAAFADAPWQGFSPLVASFPLPNPDEDGPRTIYARFRDRKGNESDPLSAEIELDRRGEVNGTLLLVGEGSMTQAQILVDAQVGGTPDANGLFSLSNIPLGEHRISARLTDFQGESRTVQVEPKKTLPGEVELTLTATKGRVTGLLTKVGPGDFSSVAFSIDGQSVTPESLDVVEGTFTLPPWPVGVYGELLVTKSGFAPARKTTLAVRPEAPTDAGTLELVYLYGRVSGTVALEEATDCQNVTVALDATVSTPVWSDCTFTLEQVPTGPHAGVRVTRAGFDPAESGYFEVQPNAAFTVPAELLLTRSRGGAYGRLLLQGESPVQPRHNGIEVSFVSLEGAEGRPAYAGVTLPDGSFTLDGLWTGAYALTARRDGFLPANLGTVTIRPDLMTNATPDGAVTLARQVGDFLINGGDPFTNDPEVLLTLSFEQATAFRLRIDGGDFTDWIDWDDPDLDGRMVYGEGGEVTIGLGDQSDDGLKVLEIETKDLLGQPSGEPYYAASIFLDTIPPTDPAVTINSGASVTNSTGPLALMLTAQDENGLAWVWISPDEEFAPAERKAYQPQIAFPMPEPSTDGPKLLHVRFADFAGNETETALASIRLDTKKPRITSLAIRSSDGTCALSPCLVRSRQVVIQVTEDFDPASESSDIRQVWIARDDPAFSTGWWQPYTPLTAQSVGEIDHDLPLTDGTTTLYLKAADEALNVAGATADDRLSMTVQLDTTPPAAPQVVAGAFVKTPSIPVSFLNTTGVHRILASFESSFEGAREDLPNAQITYDLPVGSEEGRYELWLKYRDLAGNLSEPKVISFTYDGTAPYDVRLSVLEGEIVNTPSATLVLSAIGATEMRISQTADCSGGTWEPYLTQKGVLPTGSDGPKTFSALFRDEARNESDCAPATFTVDQAPPSLTVSLNDDADFTNNRAVVLQLAASDGGAWGGVASMRLTNAASFTTEAWEAFAPEKSWMLTSGSGPKVVRVEVKDRAGNVAAGADGITLDTQAPSDVQVTISDTGGYVTASPVQITITGEDNLSAAEDLTLLVSNDPTFMESQTWPFTASGASGSWSLSAGEGLKTVYVRLIDPAGNLTDASDSVLYDTQGPQGSTAYLLEGTYLRESDVTLVAASPGADEMFISGDVAATSSTFRWIDFASSTPLVLDDTTEGACKNTGRCTLLVAFRDLAGHQEGPVSVSVVLDTLPPAGTLLIQGGAATTTSANVTLTLNVTDSISGIVGMRLTNEVVFTTEEWESYSSARSWVLDSTNGIRTVQAQVKDASGNTVTLPDSIVLDTQAPANLSVGIQGGQNFTNRTTVSVTVSATDNLSAQADLDFLLSNDPMFAASTRYSMETGGKTVTDWVLPDGDGFKMVYVRVLDEAGNTADGADGIQLDTQAPQGTLTILAGNITKDPSVNLAFTASPDVIQMRIENTENIDCATGSWDGYSGSRTGWPLGSEEKTVTVSVCFKDRAGNVGSASDSIFLDLTNPSGTITILGADPTNSATVQLLFTASDDTTQIAIQNGGAFNCGSANYDSYSRVRNWMLSSSTGPQAVSACFKDASNRTSTAAVTDSVYLDLTPPAATFAIGSGASPINDPDVTLHFSPASPADANVVWKMMVSNSASLSCSANVDLYQDYAASLPWTLSTPPSLEGETFVSACFMDRSGNVSSYTKSVFLDLSAPAGSISISGDFFRDLSERDATLVLSGPGDTDDMAVAVETTGVAPDCSDEDLAWENFAASKSVALIRNDAMESGVTNFVWLCLRDKAGNTSAAPAYARAVLDTNAPDGSVTIDGSDPTKNPYVNLSFGGVSSDVSGIAVENETIDCRDASYVFGYNADLGTILRWTLNTQDGARTVRVCFKDYAGNTSGVSDSVVLDMTPPKTPTLTAPANNAWTNQLSTTFVWTEEGDAHGPVSYHLIVSDATNNDLAADMDVAGASAPVTLENGKVYLWTVAAIDAVGNWSNYAMLSAVRVDNQGPTVPPGAVVINGGNSYTGSQSVQVTFSGVTGADEMRVACDGVMDFEGWQPFAYPVMCYLPSGDGLRTVRVVFRDAALNPSSAATGSITLDQSPPAPPTVITQGAVVNQATYDVAISGDCDDGSGSGCYGFQIKGGATPNWIYPVPVAFNPFTFRFGLQSNQTNKLSVRYVDNVGNASGEEFVLVRHDNIAPAAPTNLTVTPSDRKLKITWNRSTSSDTAGYLLYYTVDDTIGSLEDFNGTSAEQGESPIDVGNLNTFTLTGLNNDTPIYVMIRAYDQTIPANLSAYDVYNDPVKGVPMQVPINNAGYVMGGLIDDLAVRDGYIYTVSDTNGVQVYQARDLIGKSGQNHSPVGTLNQAETRRSKIELIWPYAYLYDSASVVSPRAGITVVNVLDPKDPELVGEFLTTESGNAATIQGFKAGDYSPYGGVYGYAAVKRSPDGNLVVARVDITDLTLPAFTGRRLEIAAAGASVQAMDMETTQIVLATVHSLSPYFRAHRIQFDNPAQNPTFVQKDIELPDRVFEMETSYPSIFTAIGYGVQILNGLMTSHRSFLVDPSYVAAVESSPGYLFVGYSEGTKPIRVLSLEGSSALMEVGSYRSANWVENPFHYCRMSGMRLDGNFLYVAHKQENWDGSFTSGLRAFEVSVPNNMNWTAQISSTVGRDFRGFAVRRDKLYAGTWGNWVFGYRLWNMQDPVLDFGIWAYSGDYLLKLIPFGSGLIFGIGRDNSLIDTQGYLNIVSRTSATYSAYGDDFGADDAVQWGHYMLLASRDACLKLVDLRNVSAPVVTDLYAPGYTCTSVSVNSQNIFVTQREQASGKVRTVRLSCTNPASGVTPIDYFERSGPSIAMDSVLNGDRLLVSYDTAYAVNAKAMEILDTATMTSVNYFNDYPHSNAYLEWWGNRLFTQQGYVWDMTNLSNPVQMSFQGQYLMEVHVLGAMYFGRNSAIVGYRMEP